MEHGIICLINDQSHLTAANRGFAQWYFYRNEALTMPQVNGLQIAIEIHRYFFQLQVLIYHVIVAVLRCVYL